MRSHTDKSAGYVLLLTNCSTCKRINNDSVQPANNRTLMNSSARAPKPVNISPPCHVLENFGVVHAGFEMRKEWGMVGTLVFGVLNSI